MTNFSWIDGGIVGVYLLVTILAGLSVRKYVGKVEQFLVAGREMDVYLGVASLAATEFGIVTCMSTAELGYNHGFAGTVPGMTYFLAMWLVGRTGFCIKKLRESGVITIAELFEQRFGSRVRWLAGLVIVTGGLLNMGIFLRQGGEFLVTVAGLNADYLELTMTGLLLAVAIYTIVGGMLSVLVTDYLQFIVMSIGIVMVSCVALWYVPFDVMAETVQRKHGAGGFNPLVNPNLGPSYIVFQFLLNGAAVLAWQTMVARRVGRQGRQDRRADLHPHQLLLCVPIRVAGYLGHRGPGHPAGVDDGRPQGRACHAAVPESVCAGRPDGPAGGRHVGGRYVDRRVVHAHLGQRDLQRLAGSVSPQPMERTARPDVEPRDRGGDWHLSVGFWSVVRAERRYLDVLDRDRIDLPVEHVGLVDRLLLLGSSQQLGAHGRDRRRRDLSPRFSGVGEGACNAGFCRLGRAELFGHCGFCGRRIGHDRWFSGQAGGNAHPRRRRVKNAW